MRHPRRSRRFMITAHPPACAVSRVDSTMRLRIVSGKLSPLRSSGPQPRVATSDAPGRSRLRWLCTTAFGRPGSPAGEGDSGRPIEIVARGAGTRGRPRGVRPSDRGRRTATRRPCTAVRRAPLSASQRSCRFCCSAAESASPIPAQTAPIRCAPWKAATMSRSLGRHAATRSPGRTPSDHSAPAARRAWSSSSAYDHTPEAASIAGASGWDASAASSTVSIVPERALVLSTTQSYHYPCKDSSDSFAPFPEGPRAGESDPTQQRGSVDETPRSPVRSASRRPDGDGDGSVLHPDHGRHGGGRGQDRDRRRATTPATSRWAPNPGWAVSSSTSTAVNAASYWICAPTRARRRYGS